jgi:hypothetical protein
MRCGCLEACLIVDDLIVCPNGGQLSQPMKHCWGLQLRMLLILRLYFIV